MFHALAGDQSIAPTGTNLIQFEREDVLATGVASTNDLMATIPQIGNFATIPRGTASFGQPIVQTNLRNLGASGGTTTLVLMNGHRVVGSGILQTYVDPAVIPPGVIERVEVIPDGGSSIYGSDAIGGVINFITRKDVDGVEVTGRYGSADNYHTVDANLTAGSVWDGGGFLFSYAYAEHDNIQGIDRDYFTQNSTAYPTPEFLKTKIRWGNVEFDGEMSKATPGSDLIKSLLLDGENTPVYLHAWGGQSTIARALKSIEEQYQGTPQWATIRAKVIAKAVIHPFSDQDDTYAKYIQPNWPEIRYRQHAGGLTLGYTAQLTVSEQDATYLSAQWTRKNISERGPLGAFYRVWGDGKQMVKGDIFDYFGMAGTTSAELRKAGYIVWMPVQEQGSFISEGDTGTFINLIDNGLRGYREETYGGWGGYAHATAIRPFADGLGALEGSASNSEARPKAQRAPTHPFFAAAQRDFAARFVWATTSSFGDANHHPRLTAEPSRFISARPGHVVDLRVSARDPDGNDVALRWWRWDEADSYTGVVDLDRASGPSTRFKVPLDAKPNQTIHLIAEATDNGVPALTRYERFVVTVTP